MRTQICVNGIDVETKLRLKTLAVIKRKKVYELLDDMVAREWEAIEAPITPQLARKVRKEAKRVLQSSCKRPSQSVRRRSVYGSTL